MWKHTYMESLSCHPLSLVAGLEPAGVACGTDQGGDVDKATESCRTSRFLMVNHQKLIWKLPSPGGATRGWRAPLALGGWNKSLHKHRGVLSACYKQSIWTHPPAALASVLKENLWRKAGSFWVSQQEVVLLSFSVQHTEKRYSLRNVSGEVFWA